MYLMKWGKDLDFRLYIPGKHMKHEYVTVTVTDENGNCVKTVRLYSDKSYGNKTDGFTVVVGEKANQT